MVIVTVVVALKMAVRIILLFRLSCIYMPQSAVTQIAENFKKFHHLGIFIKTESYCAGSTLGPDGKEAGRGIKHDLHALKNKKSKRVSQMRTALHFRFEGKT